MSVIFQVHSVFGEMILPVLIVLAAIYMTITYKADGPRSPVARFFPVLVDIQVTLGLIYWIFLLFTSPIREQYFGFPFILHPIIGILASGLAHRAVDPSGPLRGLGRWAPLASLGVLLVLVIGNVLIASSVPA